MHEVSKVNSLKAVYDFGSGHVSKLENGNFYLFALCEKFIKTELIPELLIIDFPVKSIKYVTKTFIKAENGFPFR